MKHGYLFISVVAGLIGCDKKGSVSNGNELMQLSEKTGIEMYAIQQLQHACDAKAERLKTYFTTTIYPDDSQFGPPQPVPDGRPVELPGVCAPMAKTSRFSSRYAIVTYLNDSEFYKRQGLRAFVCEEYYTGDNLTKIGVIKAQNQYDVLRIQRTEGVNMGVTTDSLITFIMDIHKQCGVSIVGADIDWCEFEIQKEPEDWDAFSEAIYKICPDIVEQGTNTVSALRNEIKETKRVFLWWD